MKRLIYQVYVGKRTKLYNTCTASVKEYCNKHGIDYYQQTVPKLRIKPDIFLTNRSRESYEKHGGFLPIYEKENAFEYLNTYDQVAIVDADIYIRPDAPNIFEELGDHDFAGCVEREMPITPEYKAKIHNYSHMQYANLKDVDWKWNDFGGEFMNMGLMVMNSSFKNYLKGQTPKQFLERKEFKKFVDGMGNWKWSTDQTLLNWWIKKESMNVKHLPWNYNALYKGVQDKMLPEAYFIHFFLKDKLPGKGENVEQLLEAIK